MRYIDPASWPEDVKAALLEQGKPFAANSENILAIARLAQQLRMEVPEGEGEEDWRRVFALCDNEHEIVTERATRIAEADTAYIDSYSQGTEAAAQEYEYFKRDHTQRLKAAMVVELAFAIVRSVEINAEGFTRFNRKRFEVEIDEEGAVVAGDEFNEHDKRIWRACWIVRTIRGENYRNLVPAEKDYVDQIAQLDTEDEIPDAMVSTLEALMEKVQPGYEMMSTLEGRGEVAKYLQKEARKFMRAVDMDSLDPADAAFLERCRVLTDEEFSPAVCAEVERLHARILMQ